jgi:hypothetical protein
MTDRDRAAVIAGIIISALAESVRSNAELRCRIAERLRDELADIRQELIAEIRLTEADTTPPLPSTPRKGGGHESE